MKIQTPLLLRNVVAVALAAILLSACVHSSGPLVYLTWQGNPATTMTVNFLCDEAIDPVVVQYDDVGHGNDADAYPKQAAGVAYQIPGIERLGWIHSVPLTDLAPGTTYYFLIGGVANRPPKQSGTQFRFRTLPEGDAPIRFLAAGDMGATPWNRRLLATAAPYAPMFGVIGGDVAYANGEAKQYHKWRRWLKNWNREMVGPDGALVPIVAALGNHEINDLEGTPEAMAPYFYGLLPQGGNGYFRRGLGSHTTLIVLDSGHIAAHNGEQAAWLERELAAAQDRPNIIASYHVPLYPSHREFDYGKSVAGREHWLPLFDRYGLDVGFEHHDHTFKRTKRLRNNQVDPEGAIYLGDGCFGVPPRKIDQEDAWYLEKAERQTHCWIADVGPEGMRFRAVNPRGGVFDSVTLGTAPDMEGLP